MQTSMHDVGEWRNHAHNNCYINTHHDHGIYPSDMSWSLPRPTDYDRNAISPKIRYPPKKLVLNKRDHIRHIYGVDPMLSLKLLHKKESLQTKKMKEMRAKLMSDVLKQFTFDQADVAKKHRASRLNNSSPDNKQLRKSLSVPSVLQKRRSTKTSVLAKHTESMHNMGLLMNLDANHHAMQQQDVARDTDDELSNSDEEELEEHESHWVKKFSNTYARNYWRNTKTGQSSWTDPIPGIVERREAKARAEQEEKERVEREAAEEERKKEEALRALTPAAREKEIKRQQKEEAARLREEERQRAEWEMNEKHRRAIEREWAKLAELEHKITKNMMGVKSAKKQAEEMKRLIQENKDTKKRWALEEKVARQRELRKQRLSLDKVRGEAFAKTQQRVQSIYNTPLPFKKKVDSPTTWITSDPAFLKGML